MARDYPVNAHEFARISGVGEKKLREFGEAFLAEIAAHVHTNPRQVFADEEVGSPLNTNRQPKLRTFFRNA
jgi:hypothetical protein